MNAFKACGIWPTLMTLSGLLAAGVAGAQPAKSKLDDAPSPVSRYSADLKSLLDGELVPALRRGIIANATTRPPSLTIEVTDSPSPYDIGALREPDGALRVRLSFGYLNLHDMALDAVALGATLNRPADVQRYLMYQLASTRALRESLGQTLALPHLKSFSDFVGIGSQPMRALIAQPQWRKARRTVEVESLGWTIALLLVREDPSLAGPRLPIRNEAGFDAARLAAASGWFPVPPFATALGLGAVERPTTDRGSARAYLCRAADLMSDGVDGLRLDGVWQHRLVLDAALRARIADVESQIAAMRRDGRCATPSKGLLAFSMSRLGTLGSERVS